MFFIDQERYKRSILHDSINIKDVESTLDTGDLLLLSGDSRSELVCRFFSNSIYSHICFILRHDKKLYIIESSVGMGYVSGARIISFATFIKRWANRTRKKNISKGFKCDCYDKCIHNITLGVVCRLDTRYHTRPATKNALDIFNTFSHIDFDSFMLSWCISDIVNVSEQSNMFCSQFTSFLNKRLGIDSLDRRFDASYSPEDFLHPSRIDVHYNYIPIKIY